MLKEVSVTAVQQKEDRIKYVYGFFRIKECMLENGSWRDLTVQKEENFVKKVKQSKSLDVHGLTKTRYKIRKK